MNSSVERNYDVVFVTPNLFSGLQNEPYGTLLLTTILMKADFRVKILPFSSFLRSGTDDSFADFLDRAVSMIEETGAKIVSFYTRCDTYHVSLVLAKRIKEKYCQKYVVFGGQQSDMSDEATILEMPQVDYICRGEGENTIVPFFSSLMKDEPDLSIRGLSYRKDGAFVRNPDVEPIDDLDALPTVDYAAIDIGFHKSESIGEMKRFSIDIGRGCPFACTYCSTKTFWKRRYRLKGVEKILEEIVLIHDLYGVTQFDFEHDMFTMNKSKVMKICEGMKRLDFAIKWTCSARLDCLDEELIDCMVDSGLRHIYIGIETGSARMQRVINKNLKLEKSEALLDYICSKGIKATVSFIYGFPEELEEDIDQTADLWVRLSRIKGLRLQAHLLAFFPGTELEQKYREMLTFSENISNQTNSFGLVECSEFINAHPKLFPQYRELMTPMRTNLKYFGIYLHEVAYLPQIFEYLAKRYFDGSLYHLYSVWRIKNEQYLSDIRFPDTMEGIDMEDLICKDALFAAYADDDQYHLICEIVRYWEFVRKFKESDKLSATEVFRFCYEDYKSGMPICEYRDGITVLKLSKDTDKRILVQYNSL